MNVHLFQLMYQVVFQQPVSSFLQRTEQLDIICTTWAAVLCFSMKYRTNNVFIPIYFPFFCCCWCHLCVWCCSLTAALPPCSPSGFSCRTSPKARGPWLQLRPELSCWRETRMVTGRLDGKVGRSEGAKALMLIRSLLFIFQFPSHAVMRRSTERIEIRACIYPTLITLKNILKCTCTSKKVLCWMWGTHLSSCLLTV